MSDPSKRPHMMGNGWQDRRSLSPAEQLEQLIDDPSCTVTVTEKEIIIQAPDYPTYVVAKFKIKAAAGAKPIRGRYGSANAQ